MSDNREAECIGALYFYFKELHDLNRNVITLLGFNAYDNADDYESIAQRVICAIPRLLPYEWSKACGTYVIGQKDGLMEFSDQLTFLESGFHTILESFHNETSCFLSSVKKIRNKLEHQIHGVSQSSVSSGADDFTIVFHGSNDDSYRIDSHELISFLKALNEQYAHIQDWVKGTTTFREKSDYPYMRRITRYSFRHFNEIFDSKIASIIGTGMGEF